MSNAFRLASQQAAGKEGIYVPQTGPENYTVFGLRKLTIFSEAMRLTTTTTSVLSITRNKAASTKYSAYTCKEVTLYQRRRTKEVKC
jgi:hypothetical protein